MSITIRPRERNTLITALRSGVVPRQGLQHIQVGRTREIKTILRDIDTVSEGGAACRFIIGEYGAGKTFFLNLVKNLAYAQKLVITHADLSPDRKLHGNNGQARALYEEMIRQLCTRSQPNGGALTSIVERFIDTCNQEKPDDVDIGAAVEDRLTPLRDLTGGNDWIRVLRLYAEHLSDADPQIRNAALTWLSAGFGTRTESRLHLKDIRTIIDDASAYDHTKILSKFLTLAGYQGLIVIYDEMVNIHRIINSAARVSNYEHVLRMVNDLMQGNVEHLGIYFAGTPQFLTDPRRGLYSYEALRSRLSENSFAQSHDLVDVNGPVIRLQALTAAELFLLLTKVRDLHEHGKENPLPDEAIHAFLNHCQKRIGNQYFQTPRTSIRDFLGLLSVLDQNPNAVWTDLLERVTGETAKEDEPVITPDDEPTEDTSKPHSIFDANSF